MRKGNKSLKYPHLYSSHVFHDKIQRNSKKNEKSYNNMIITRHSRATKEHRASSKIEKLLLRCVIILILKIHYSNTEFFSFFVMCLLQCLIRKILPNCVCLYTAFQLYNLISLGVLNDFLLFFFFVHSGDKENLIWNKSRNTFFIADNSNAFFFSLCGYILLFPFVNILSAVCNGSYWKTRCKRMRSDPEWHQVMLE